MRKRIIVLAAALVAWGIAGTARAITCYVIYDRAGVVTYRSPGPPLDLSDVGAPARTVMRERGEHLIIADFDQCLPPDPGSKGSGAAAASVEDIVSGMRPYGASTGGLTGSVRNASEPSSSSPATPGRSRASSGGTVPAYK